MCNVEIRQVHGCTYWGFLSVLLGMMLLPILNGPAWFFFFLRWGAIGVGGRDTK